MKDITRSVLRYTRDILIVLIILVFLARTGNMPVIVPDKVTDFIIDVTSDLFSGRVFSSFGGFLSDIGDFFLTGGTDRDNRRQLELYRKRVEQYFDRTRRNLLFLAAHPDIRRSLPDFRNAFAGMYAKAMLENTVNTCFDVDRMGVYSGNGQLIVEAKGKDVQSSLTLADIRKMAAAVQKKRSILIRFTPQGRLLFAVSFSSKFREKYGMLLMEINSRGIHGQLKDAAKVKGFYFYCSDEQGQFFADSGTKPGPAFRKSLKSGKRSLSLLQEERFVTVGALTRRTYQQPLQIGGIPSALKIGLLGPDGNILSFALLMLRLILLVGVIWLFLFLLRRILQLTRQIFRDRGLTRKLLEVSLEKSLDAGSRIEAAAEKAVDTARMASEAIGRGAGMLKETPVRVEMRRATPQLPEPGTDDGQPVLPDEHTPAQQITEEQDNKRSNTADEGLQSGLQLSLDPEDYSN